MTVIFIDGKNALYRFGYALKTLATEDGTKTGAIHGFLSILLRLKTKYPDAKFVVVWDGREYRKGWRSQVFPAYKGNRTGEQSAELQEILLQAGTIQRCLTLMGVTQSVVDEIECDDLIGVLSAQCLKKGLEPIIYSTDKDFLQLMHRGVKVIRDVVKPSTLNPEDVYAVHDLFRCTLPNVLKVRAICGDGSDGIPGIQKGVGVVRAAAMVGSCRNWDLVCRQNSDLARNYRIMRIVTEVNDAELSSEHQDALAKECSRVIGILSGTVRVMRDGTERRVLMCVLAELELSELLGRRDELWALS
jgi:DNA polymerase-1